MLIPGIVLSVVGVGFFCWLLLTLAVYALPFFTGLTAVLAAFQVGSGVIGALVIGVLAGGEQPWRSDRSPSQRRQGRSSAPQSRSSMRRRRPSPATTPRSGSRSSRSPPKAGAMRSPLLARFSSLRTALARMSLFVPPTVGQRVAGPARSLPLAQGSARGAGLRRHRRSVGNRGRDRSSTRMRASPHLGRSGRSTPLSPPRRVRSSGRVVVVVQVAADHNGVLLIRHRFLFFAWKAGPLVRGADFRHVFS